MTSRPVSPTVSTLARIGVEPSKALGQNFLTDDNLARWMADTLRAEPGDTLVEIGPGAGAVTRHLAALGCPLILIEKDPRLAALQRELWAGRDDITVIEGDAMETDLRPFFKHGPLRVYGNLPYSAGTHILAHWLENPSPVTRAVFMLQKEVCDRIAAEPRTKDYGQLTVRVQSRWHAEILKIVGPQVFHPRPTVDSAVIALTPRLRASLPVFDEVLYSRLVKLGFTQRRKQLKNLLPASPVSWEALTTALGVPATVRAEEMSIPTWVDLCNHYDPHPLKDKAQCQGEIFDVVDDDDQVTGQATRREVHAQKLKHRAVHVFVINRRGDLLLQKRSHLKDTCPEKWDSSASGHLDSGEDYATSAIRELGEEVGLTKLKEPPQRLLKLSPCQETGWEFVELHLVRHDGPARWPASEVETVAWFSPEEIEAWSARRPQDFAPGFLLCFRTWRAAAPVPQP